MDIIAFIIGFIAGVIVVGFAIELGMRKTRHPQPTARPTHSWSFDEFKNPRIVAEDLGTITLPKNARIVVNKYDTQDSLKGLSVRQHPGIRGNFVIDDERALVLSGSLSPNALGVWTIEKAMIDKLNTYFEDSWNKASSMQIDENEP